MKNRNESYLPNRKAWCRGVSVALLASLLPLQAMAEKHESSDTRSIYQANKTFTLHGIVQDEAGEALIGVNIRIEGSDKGTTTDYDGKFSLDVKKGDILLFSYIGYDSHKQKVESKKKMIIELQESTKALSEVVVVGYGTLDKKEVTSSISSIRSSDLISGAMSSPLEAIKGKVTNLSIINSNGADPNTGLSIQLRGANSINAGQGPLIVVDGVPGGNFNDIQKEDIQSIDILKDASAAAIYGTRGSGGVILVTTKQAQAGKTKLNYTAEFTTESVRRKADVLTASEFLANDLGEYEGNEDLDAIGIENVKGTDWFNEVTRDNPFTQRHAISLSGGSENLKTYTSLYYKKAEGMAIGSSRREVGGRVNVIYNLWEDRLQFTGRVSYSDIESDRSPNSMFRMALKLNPTIPVYDETNPTGYNVITGGYDEWNPVADAMLMEDLGESRNMMSSFTTRLNIIEGLNTTLTIGNKTNSARQTNWRSKQHHASIEEGVRGWAKMESKEWSSVNLDWLFNFSKQIKKHNVNAVAGYSFQQYGFDGFYAENKDFPVDGVKWWDLSSGTFLNDGRASLDSYKNPRERIIAFLARANYSYDNRYMITASARYEGISKLTPDNRWGLFPSVSAGWRLSSEGFMEDIEWISDLKLRFGWGITGNADFSGNVATRMYSPDSYWLADGTWFKTYGLSHNVNPDLKWEKKHEYNIGLDYAFLNNRLTGKIDVYQRNVEDLIYSISVPQPPAVHNSMLMNSGTLQNRGIEVEVSANIVQNKNWNYSTTLTASHNRTTLKSLWGSQTFWDRKGFEAPGSPGTAVRLIAGEEIGRFYIWKYAGIDEDGNWLLYNKDNEVIPATEKTDEDKRFIGNAIPKVILGWENSLSYKNFDLTLFFRSWIGHDVFNKVNMYYGLPNVGNQNVLSNAFEENSHIKGEKELCDYWLEDGSFLKLDALTLGYTFKIPKIKKYVSSVRASFTARDVFCITGYSGLDPEVNINGLDPGFEEQDLYPKVRSFTFGLQLNF